LTKTSDLTNEDVLYRFAYYIGYLNISMSSMNTYLPLT
jgi:hypothetical protein